MPAANSKKAVTAAIAGNIAIAIVKYIAAAITGSSAMLSEAVHSTVDTGNDALLLLGMRRSKKPSDEAHPFGHGKELYFWSLIVAMVIFAGGGGMSLYEGILHLLHPEPPGDPFWNYIVLGFAAVFEGTSLLIGLREFRKVQRDKGFFETIHKSKDPSTFTVVLEDSAALIGIAVAFTGIWLTVHFRNSIFDGSAAILIGLILAAVAGLLAYESRGLLIGEAASPALRARIEAMVEADGSVKDARRLYTMYLGPHTILLTMNVQFRDGLSGAQLEEAIDRIESGIRSQNPDIRHIFIEADSLTRRN